VVTDVDGTLTSSELAAVTSVIGLPDPEAHPGAADMLRAFYQRGYYIYYLTARPEWLMQITRDWINARGFPPGVINTTQSKIGANGDGAATFKTGELKLLKAKTDITPSYAFGNKASDVTAFLAAEIQAKNSYYYELDGDLGQGIRHNDYQQLVRTALDAPSACP
jgi:phosphatidate phosphatase PAH1